MGPSGPEHPVMNTRNIAVAQKALKKLAGERRIALIQIKSNFKGRKELSFFAVGVKHARFI
jgi:hypothetical protein